jgi:ABC-type transport system substrate-binding protein
MSVDVRTRFDGRGRSGHVLRLAVVVLTVLASVAACSSSDDRVDASDTTPPAPSRGGSVVVGTGAEIDGLNPMVNQWSGPGYVIGRAVMDPLVVMDREGNWQPYLAEAITPNETFTEWTFELRADVAFHNGEVLDAEALALYFDAVTTSPLSSQGFPEKPEITVVDPLTVRLTFTEPWSAMPTVLVEQPGYVIAPEQIRSGDSRHPIGTGPFVFDEWVADSHLRVSRNPDYWREGLPYLDGIEFRPIADAAARRDALRSGELDVVELSSETQANLEDLAGEGMTVVDDVDNVGAAILLMNGDRAPLDDPDVRLALVSAIDRELYRDTVRDPSFEIADQPYPDGSRWHSEVDYPSFDLERATELVDEHEAEHGPVELEMMVVNGAATDGPLFLQQALGDAGIDVEILDLELTAFIRRLIAGDYDLVNLGTFFGAPDPDGSYSFVHSSGADPDALVKLNFARYRNDEVDEALDAQRRTDDVDVRRTHWATVWDRLAEDLPFAFLHYDSYALVSQPEVFGLDAPTTPDGVDLPAVNRWTPFFTQVFVAEPG